MLFGLPYLLLRHFIETWQFMKLALKRTSDLEEKLIYHRKDSNYYSLKDLEKLQSSIQEFNSK